MQAVENKIEIYTTFTTQVPVDFPAFFFTIDDKPHPERQYFDPLPTRQQWLL